MRMTFHLDIAEAIAVCNQWLKDVEGFVPVTEIQDVGTGAFRLGAWRMLLAAEAKAACGQWIRDTEGYVVSVTKVEKSSDGGFVVAAQPKPES